MKKNVLALSFIAFFVALAGCSNHEEQKEDKKTSTQVTVKQKENTANKLNFEELYPNEEVRDYAKKMIGTKAPNFRLKNLKGESVELTKLKGQNVLLEIASTTCPACIGAYPNVKDFKDSVGNQVKVLTVFPNETKKAVEDFFAKNNYKRDDQVIPGEGMNSVITDYQVKYTPTFIFIDKKGYIQFVYVGGDVNDTMLSSMSDLAFKTNLTKKYNKTEEVPLEKPAVPKETTDKTVKP